jgi:tRNA threonylcarbamoyladenosine biosynthesis protein TsaE
VGSSILTESLFRHPDLAVDTASEADTLRIARALGALLAPGDWLMLTGDLGSGKTVFVRGVAEALGCRDRARSPTFVLMHTYKPGPRKIPLHHVDLYRVGPRDVNLLDWDPTSFPGVTAVEWAEKAARFWPANALAIRLGHAGQDHRRIEFSARGTRPAALLKKLKETTAE